MRTYCVAQGILLDALWWPEWKRNPKGKGYMHVCVLNCFSCVWLWDHVDCSPPGSSVHGDSPGKNAGMGCQSHPQGIFLTQRSKLHLLCFLHWQTGSLRLVPPGKPRYMSTYGQSILLYSRISYNTVKQLYSNKKLFLKKNWACLKEKTPHPMVY